MTEVTKQFELRQLLKAYRKGLISDELFEEQLADIADGGPAPRGGTPARTYRVRDKTFGSERAMVLHFLDEFRAGETFGGEVFSAWHDVASDPRVRGGLAVVREREAMHGRILGDRLARLGGTARADLAEKFKASARTRLGSAEVSDAEKVGDFVRRLPDADAAVAPIRDVIAQIEDDRETRALLESIVEDELATVRWFHATAEAVGTAAGAPPAPRGTAGNGAAGKIGNPSL